MDGKDAYRKKCHKKETAETVSRKLILENSNLSDFTFYSVIGSEVPLSVEGSEGSTTSPPEELPLSSTGGAGSTGATSCS